MTMRKSYLLFSVLFFLFSCKQELTIKTINISDYGILVNTRQSITAEINQLIESLGEEMVTIVFPKGRYDFFPDSNYFRPYFETNTYDINPKRLAVLIDKKKNITIDAQGSDFIFHGHIQPFTLDNSENIFIKDVNIDWDNPLNAESEIIEADSNHILMKIDTIQFPYKVHNKGLTFAADDWNAEWKLSAGSWLIEFTKEHIIPAYTGDHGCVNGDLKNVKYLETVPGMVLMEGEFTKTPAVGNYLI